LFIAGVLSIAYRYCATPVHQPLAVPNLPEDDSGGFDLTPMLTDLYQKIDALPAICFEFDREAKTYHRTSTLKCH